MVVAVIVAVVVAMFGGGVVGVVGVDIRVGADAVVATGTSPDAAKQGIDDNSDVPRLRPWALLLLYVPPLPSSLCLLFWHPHESRSFHRHDDEPP